MEPSLPPIPSNQPMLHPMHNKQYVMNDLPSNATICEIYTQEQQFSATSTAPNSSKHYKV